ncbi:MAG TPA: tyrosine-type recombinase/integrase [bacterium]|nr:tyrosine-type recombinase/integrase [bacterium]
MLKDDLNRFLEYLEVERGLANNTLIGYSFYLKRFLAFATAQNVNKVSQISQDLIHRYRLHLNRLANREYSNLKKNTQNYHLIALRQFLKYLSKNDIESLDSNKVELAKQEPRQVTFLEGYDLAAFLQAPLATPKSSKLVKLRDRAILEMLFSTGLRVSELARLRINDVNLKKTEFTVRGKGSKLRLVFLSNDAKMAIKTYLEARQDTEPFLFIGHGKINKDTNPQYGLTPRSIERLVEKYAVAAGITKRVTPHTLRHSFATDLLIGGADIRSVQQLLGHASITTTQVYTHVTDQQLRQVYQNFHGKSRQKIDK